MPFSHKSFVDESVLCRYFLSSLDMHQSCFLTMYIINFSVFSPSCVKERKKRYCFDYCYEKYNKADYVFFFFCIFSVLQLYYFTKEKEVEVENVVWNPLGGCGIYQSRLCYFCRLCFLLYWRTGRKRSLCFSSCCSILVMMGVAP